MHKQKRLVIIGASGHGKVVADIALLNGYKDIVFLDDNEKVKECAGFPVIGTTEKAIEEIGDKIVAIGNSEMRKAIQQRIETVSLIHPNAIIGRDVDIEAGTVVMAGAVINHGAKIGKGCIINTSSSVDHDCTIGDYVHVAVGAHICGTVNVGSETWIGAGATVINNLDICSGVFIGAGATVVSNLESKGVYIGIPARKKS